MHLEKAKGADSKMSAHIERTSHPKNADETRTHLNRELVQFPEGVNNRTEAIAHRIGNAGIKRKIADNQVRAIRVLLTGTNEDMKRMEADGTLGNWCDDNLKWLRETFGKDNVVSAVLHMVEQTADEVRAIATASEEQSAASEEITRSISEVNEITFSTSEAMQTAAHGVESLRRRSQDLVTLIEEMKKG